MNIVSRQGCLGRGRPRHGGVLAVRCLTVSYSRESLGSIVRHDENQATTTEMPDKSFKVGLATCGADGLPGLGRSPSQGPDRYINLMCMVNLVETAAVTDFAQSPAWAGDSGSVSAALEIGDLIIYPVYILDMKGRAGR